MGNAILTQNDGKILNMEVETVYLADLDLSLAREIAVLLCTIWPKPGRTVETRIEQLTSEGKAYHGPQKLAPRSFFIRSDAQIVAHAAVLPRTIGTNRGEMTIAGLARVCADPAWRGCGLGEQIARAAFAPIDDGTFPVILFQTTAEVRPFYEKLGGRAIENKIVNSLADDPTANPFWNGEVMIYPAEADWPAGEIDLRGPGY